MIERGNLFYSFGDATARIYFNPPTTNMELLKSAVLRGFAVASEQRSSKCAYLDASMHGFINKWKKISSVLNRDVGTRLSIFFSPTK